MTNLTKISLLLLAMFFMASDLLNADSPTFPDPNNRTITGHHRDGLLERLTAQRDLASVGLSPNGKYLTGLIAEGEEQRAYIWRADNPVLPKEVLSADGEVVPIGWNRLPFTRSDIRWLAWVGDNRLVISVDDEGLMLVDAETGSLTPLVSDPLVQQSMDDSTLPVFLISAMPDDPTRMLVQWEDPETRDFPAVYEIDIDKGTAVKVQNALSPIIRWWATDDGIIKAGEGYRARKHDLYLKGGVDWERAQTRDVFKDADFSIMSLTADGAGLVIVTEGGSDVKALWHYDIKARDYTYQIAANDRFDIAGAVFDPIDHTVAAATYTDLVSEQEIVSDSFQARLQDAEDRIGLNPNDLSARLWLGAASADGKKVIYQVRSEKHPFKYYLYDAGNDTYTAINPDGAYDDFHRTTSAWIKLPKKRGEMQMVLSVPKNTKGRINLTGKGVLLIHGGPVRRSSQRYNRFLNWLTAHGYAVLQPNFRGSDGYGAHWRRSGYQEWGADMQDDIETAAEWFVKEGYVDPDKLCAVGGSYGGYAALLGVVKDDDLFQCAVSLNGVTSIPHLVTYLSSRRFSLLTVPRIRGGLSNRTLRRRSPLYLARKLKRPTLLLHATNDANVPFEHGQLMASVLKQYDKDYGFIVLAGAEHQLKHPRFRKTYYESALQFLEKHIGDKRPLPFDKPMQADTDDEG